MKPNWSRKFIVTAGCLLLVAGAAKIVSAFGHSHILTTRDPIFTMTFRNLMWTVGTIELAAGAGCLFFRYEKAQIIFITWLATSFMLYRLGLYFDGYQRPCACFGNLSDNLHVSPVTADAFAKAIAVFLLVGGYSALFCVWKRPKTATSLRAQEK